jgi:hypothetical protein
MILGLPDPHPDPLVRGTVLIQGFGSVPNRIGKNLVKKKQPSGVFLVRWCFFWFFQFQEYFQVHPDFKLLSLLLITLFLLIYASDLD